MKPLLLLTFTLVYNFSVAQSQYFIVFRANPATSVASPGHAFASFVKKDESLSQTIIEHTWGFHPINKSLKAVFSTEGEVEKVKIGDLGKSDFVVEVDHITYEYCKKLKDRWASKRYGAIGTNQNCVDFVKQLAELVTPDLVMPSVVYQLPRPFLDNLRTVNAKRDAESRQALSEVTGGQTNLVTQPNTVAETKPQRVESTATNNNLLGGKTPEELGRMMFKTIQTNNFNTWIRFIHPSATEEDRKIITGRLAKYRTKLEEQGLTDWSQVEFSQATFKFGNAANHSVPFGKVAYNFTVKFYYKKREYLGWIDLGSIATEPDKEIYQVYRISIGDTGLVNNTNLFR